MTTTTISGDCRARGDAFPTTDVPWGYAYFLALFYRVFGDRPWIPLLAQALLNGLVPIMLYRLVSLEFDRRTALVAAVLTGFLSFNTLYASTQSSDAVCTVVFIAALLLFAEGRARGGVWWFAASGALFGLAPQFVPTSSSSPLLAGSRCSNGARASAWFMRWCWWRARPPRSCRGRCATTC